MIGVEPAYTWLKFICMFSTFQRKIIHLRYNDVSLNFFLKGTNNGKFGRF